MPLEILKFGSKYGLPGLLLIYLVYFLTTSISTKMDKMVEFMIHSDSIHVQMLTTLQEIRDHRGSFSMYPSAVKQ